MDATPETERIRVQAETIANLERGVRGPDRPGDIWPNWVYEARDAIRHQNDGLPWLPDLLAALGWQGGTVHEALNAVRRLVAASKGPPHGECPACGFPNKADGCCSRNQCCNSD